MTILYIFGLFGRRKLGLRVKVKKEERRPTFENSRLPQHVCDQVHSGRTAAPTSMAAGRVWGWRDGFGFFKTE